MEERLYPLLYRVLPPRAYHVYLHPDDYREIETIAQVIAADAQRALTERVDTLNRRPRWQGLLLGKQPPIEPPSAGWEISIHPDANSELERGQIGIVSRLSVARDADIRGRNADDAYRAHGRDRHAATHDDARRSRRAARAASGRRHPCRRRCSRVAAAPTAAWPTPPALPWAPTRRDRSLANACEAARGVAQLAYVDEQGPHVFVMRKDVVSIGRGGSAHWVDVQVTTGPRVSREHCRIRRADDGRFFLQDLSTWGTSVNGQRVKPYVHTSPAGQLEETGQEHELPRDARIQLADALLIEFQTLDPQ